MGCDGGTIPKRDELVRTKKKPEQKDKVADLAFKWRHCAISQEALVRPVMACEQGRLYNKESVLEFLIDRSKFECASNFSHLRGLKDVKELKLTENPSAKQANSAEKGDSYIDMQVADYICPLTSTEMNGKSRFCFLWACGCVFSERALKEIKAETCHKCGQAYSDGDMVALNGNEADVALNMHKMDMRRMQAKLAKKAKKSAKRSLPAETTTSGDGAASSAKQSRTESSTVASTSSKLVNGTSSQSSKPVNGSSTNGKLTNGSRPKAAKTIQDNPNVSSTYKSLFNTCEQAKNQTQGHWITYNPQYF